MKPSEAIAREHMSNRDLTFIQKINQALIPLIFGFVVTYGVYTHKELRSHSERLVAIEEWRTAQSKALTDAMAVNTKERDNADEAMRVRILREVETAAATQRENVLAQLASIQRDVLRIAIILDLRQPKEPTSYKPSNGDQRKGGDSIDSILSR